MLLLSVALTSFFLSRQVIVKSYFVNSISILNLHCLLFVYNHFAVQRYRFDFLLMLIWKFQTLYVFRHLDGVCKLTHAGRYTNQRRSQTQAPLEDDINTPFSILLNLSQGWIFTTIHIFLKFSFTHSNL